MLKDRINNHLTVVLMSVTQRWQTPTSAKESELLQAAIAATGAVSRVLEELLDGITAEMESTLPNDRAGTRAATTPPVPEQQEAAYVGKGGYEDR